jgi:ribulose 1,5-bisphosphate synthetase/thiazole synthase
MVMPEPSNNAHYDVDVIVVDAGPIGLTTACALAPFSDEDRASIVHGNWERLCAART